MIKKVLEKICYKLPIKMKNYILFESIPTYSDNTRNVFLEIIKRQLNQKYKLIWITEEDVVKFSDIQYKNVYFINKKEINKIKLLYIRLHAKFIIDCNNYIKKLNYKQTRIYLTHGMPLKTSDEYGKLSGKIDYITANSEIFKGELSKIFNINEDRILITGAARNDSIFNSHNILFPSIKRNKTIVWMPTYRNHRKTDSYEGRTNINYIYGVPCIDNEKQFQELNEILKAENALLIIKLHPQENQEKIERLELSNIKLLNNDYFNYDESIYDFLSSIDALITDYSSVYYDFLLTNKLIGLAIPDLNEYIKHVRLGIKKYEEDIVGEYIYKFKDLKHFIMNVIEEKDEKLQVRIEANNRYNKYHDGKSAQRIVDFLEDKMKGNKSEK